MKRWWRPLFQLASLFIFALIVWYSGPEAWEKIASGIPKYILLALLLRGVSGMLATTRLQTNTHGIAGRRLSWRRLYYVTMTTRALGMLIPRSVSTIGGKSVALRSHDISMRRSLWIVLVDNLYDVALLGLLVLTAVLVWYGDLDDLQVFTLISLSLLLGGMGVWWGTHNDRLTRFFFGCCAFR